MVPRWNGSMPRARRRRTASKSEVGASPCFWAMRRAMRSSRPVRPCLRMSSMVSSVAVSRLEAICPARRVLSSAAGAAVAAAAPGAFAGAASGVVGRSPASCASVMPGWGLRRIRNFLALGFVVIELLCLFQGIKHIQLSAHQDSRGLREFFKYFGFVGHDHDGGGAQPFAQNLAGLAVELDIGRTGHALVDQIDVEIKRQHQRKGEPRAHPRGIGAQRLIEIFAQIAQPAAERLDVIGVEPVETRDVAGVFHRRDLRDDAAHETQRKADTAAAADFALVGFLEPRHHVDQCRLAGAIGGEDTKRLAQFDTKRHAVKDHLALRACPEGLAHIVEFEHPGRSDAALASSSYMGTFARRHSIRSWHYAGSRCLVTAKQGFFMPDTEYFRAKSCGQHGFSGGVPCRTGPAGAHRTLQASGQQGPRWVRYPRHGSATGARFP